jgi:DNA polymerase-3 subunit delta'
LPETVVSRCRRVDFVPLGPEAIRRVLVEHHGMDPERAEWAARVGGNLARALRMANDPDAAARRAAHIGLPSRLASGDLADAIRAAEDVRREAEAASESLREEHERELAELAEMMGEGRGTGSGRKRLADRQKREARRAELDSYLYALDDLATAYRDRLIAATGAGEELMVDPEAVTHLPRDPAPALEALERIEQTRLAIERNVAPRLALEALLVSLGALPVG